MFQAIYYDHFQKKATVRDCSEGWLTFDYKRKFYKIDPKGKYPTLDGKRANLTYKYDPDDQDLYEKDVDINLRVLLDLYQESDEPPSYHNRVFLDIETEMGGSINLPYCQASPVKVTAIALYDENTKTYYAFVLDENDRIQYSEKDNVVVIPFSNEESMFLSFLDRWEAIDPTILIHFNGDSFDVPYLYNRMLKILGTEDANRLSPLGKVILDEYDSKMPYKIAGVNSMDFLRLYKKFIPKQKPSYKLDSICIDELGYGKIKYEGSLDHLFATDPDKYIEYNINDVKLIVDLEKKKKFVDLAVLLAHMGHVPYHYVYQSSRLIEGAIMTYLKRKNIVSPNKPTTINPDLRRQLSEESEDDDKFAGAYVKEPIPGLYGWNIDLDEQSLYPLTILQLNASPETFLFKVVCDDRLDMSWTLQQMKEKDPNMKVRIKSYDGRVKAFKLKKIINIIENNSCTVAPNGTVFSTEEKGIVCDVVEEWFERRNKFKNTMKEYGKLGDTLMYEFYDQMQSTMKIFLNSIYGVLGLKSFRYTDGEDLIAEATTISGRFIITQTADFINEKINKEISS